MHVQRLQCLHYDEEQPLDSLRARVTSHQYFPEHTKTPPHSYTHNRREPQLVAPACIHIVKEKKSHWGTSTFPNQRT